MSPIRRPPPRVPDGANPLAEQVPAELRRALVEDWVSPADYAAGGSEGDIVVMARALRNRARRLWLKAYEVPVGEQAATIPVPVEPMAFEDWAAFESARDDAKAAREIDG